MVTTEDYGTYETAWCPGCGNHSLLEAVKQGLVAARLEPHQVLFVSDIGQGAKAPHYLNANVFNGLHGGQSPVQTNRSRVTQAPAPLHLFGRGRINLQDLNRRRPP